MAQTFDKAGRSEDVSRFTVQVGKDLPRRADPEQAKGLPSFLPLRHGMRLLRSSEDLVRTGLVKRRVCILKGMRFADGEPLPLDHVVGHPDPLSLRRYMPISWLLRAGDEQWMLEATVLPKPLPSNLGQ